MSEPATIIAQIASALGESEQKPLRQIEHIVTRCGQEQALGWLEEAQATEAAGGLRTKDGSRPRTPGGIYFFLVRQHLREAKKWQLIEDIFGPPWSPGQEALVDTALPIATWAERRQLQAEIGDECGKATNVKVTLIGRPGKTIERQNFALLMMTHSGSLPALPKGIPVPDKLPTTSYVVYIGNKQWRKVKEALKNPSDILIIEGTQIWDDEYQAIAVFATNVTTKLLQQRQREQQKQEQQAQATQ
ncbi:MAG: hypothetical protein HC893_16720 [Chloroflexaceae bacterium]|nr:hypothetical protein [Chloroflexaceae bacterium]